MRRVCKRDKIVFTYKSKNTSSREESVYLNFVTDNIVLVLRSTSMTYFKVLRLTSKTESVSNEEINKFGSVVHKMCYCARHFNPHNFTVPTL